MTLRAAFSPGLRYLRQRYVWHKNLLAALGMGATVVILGCGGGGGGGGGGNNGGGGGSDACQDNPALGTNVICGYVLNEGTTNGVNAATVAVKSSTGTTLGSIRTYRNNATGKDGYYVLAVPAGATLFSVTPPASGFLASYFRYVSVYDINRTPASGGPCIPAIPTLPTPNAGNILQSFFLFPDSSTPPPPVFVCPRP